MKSTHPILTIPTSPEHARSLAAALIASHRPRFGAARMELDGDSDDANDSGDEGEKKPPTPRDVAEKAGERKLNEHGYPDNTPVKEMTTEERAAYDTHKRQQNAERRHEWNQATGGRSPDQVKADLDELERRRREEMTPAEQALADARRQGEQEGRQAERATWARRTVQAEIKGALRGRKVPEERIESMVKFLDHNSFLTDDGEVDTAKVTDYASGFGQETPPPDMGQGRRGNNDAKPSVARARDAYLEERRGKTQR